ncbi:hypothetical protein F511_36921 [Dorcoceras hygrometricum]|uniref:Uncharacterized protein n=1 Tax=Dorcoceras hygrometricum TaxID=472368 RepID=A0A2Z7C4S8_9LAMI|nr:hypothetical protein F511_36921 [Dorcoceras hygrometricum]
MQRQEYVIVNSKKKKSKSSSEQSTSQTVVYKSICVQEATSSGLNQNRNKLVQVKPASKPEQSAHVLKDIKPAEALNDKGRKVQPCLNTFQRKHLCVQRIVSEKGLHINPEQSTRRRGVRRKSRNKIPAKLGGDGGGERGDVLSMQIDSDLVIYRTTLVRTFQVVIICRVDKSESTRSVLGKCVYLVTLAMSLFDLQDVRIVIGSIATLDLPMVVDLIGIYGLKGPYCTLTMTNWFLQALSVIPRRSWGDVARRSYHDPLGSRRRRPPPPVFAGKFVSDQFDEENPFVLISSVLLVQADEGVSFLVVDRIDDIYRSLPRRADVIVTAVGARHKCQQGSGFEHPIKCRGAAAHGGAPPRAFERMRAARDERATAGRRCYSSTRTTRGIAPKPVGTSRMMLRPLATRWPAVGATLVARRLGGGAQLAARLRRWRLDVGWPMLRRRAARGARWPDDAAEDGRAMEALVDVARTALRCVALRAMVRALPPRFRGGGAAVAGRRSGESPAMS